jgi:hypothetical protein
MLDVEKKLPFRGVAFGDALSHDQPQDASRREEWLSSRVEFLEKKVILVVQPSLSIHSRV